jgi:Cu/Ag efflux pump CusA
MTGKPAIGMPKESKHLPRMTGKRVVRGVERCLDRNIAIDAPIRNSPDSISELLIDAPDGTRVRLGDLADVSIQPAPNVIRREVGSRRIDVTANVAGRDLGSVAREVERQIQQVKFPDGYHAEVLGEYAERQAAQQRLFIFAAAAVVSTSSDTWAKPSVLSS